MDSIAMQCGALDLKTAADWRELVLNIPAKNAWNSSLSMPSSRSLFAP